MNRKKLPKGIEAKALVESRRRCCVCYGLKLDFRVKQGQIAHLDHNSSNDNSDNLVFLCFDHHDIYDSKTSQSKNLTIREIKEYKEELLVQIKRKWQGKHGGANYPDYFSGEYVRFDDETAYFNVQKKGTNKVQVTGSAQWGKDRKYGPNVGELDFLSVIDDNKVRFEEQLSEYVIRIDFTFFGHRLKVEESYLPNRFGYFGMNVTFEGEYYKKVNL